MRGGGVGVSSMNEYLERVETRARRNYDRVMEELVDATL